jgi:hypothetical protein
VEHDIDFSAALGCLWLDSASAVLQAASLASRLYPDVHTGFHRRAALVAFPVGLAMSILHMDSYSALPTMCSHATQTHEGKSNG